MHANAMIGFSGVKGQLCNISRQKTQHVSTERSRPRWIMGKDTGFRGGINASRRAVMLGLCAVSRGRSKTVNASFRERRMLDDVFKQAVRSLRALSLPTSMLKVDVLEKQISFELLRKSKNKSDKLFSPLLETKQLYITNSYRNVYHKLQCLMREGHLLVAII